MSRGRTARPRPTRDSLAATAHQLRSSLNGIHTWAHLLEVRLGPSAEPSIRRALDGIHAGVRTQVTLIENLLEARAPETPRDKPGQAKPPRKPARAGER